MTVDVTQRHCGILLDCRHALAQPTAGDANRTVESGTLDDALCGRPLRNHHDARNFTCDGRLSRKCFVQRHLHNKTTDQSPDISETTRDIIVFQRRSHVGGIASILQDARVGRALRKLLLLSRLGSSSCDRTHDTITCLRKRQIGWMRWRVETPLIFTDSLLA